MRRKYARKTIKRKKTRKASMRRRRVGGGNRTYVCIIAYRARSPHEMRRDELKRAMESIISYFTKYKKEYRIVVVEQNNDTPFNIGILKNIGFLEAEKKYPISKVYLHMNTDYTINSSKDFPKELDDFSGDGVLDIYNIIDTGAAEKQQLYVGGCCCFGSDTFKKLNGFPNDFDGWGGDDAAFMQRIKLSGVPYIRNGLTNSGWIQAEDKSPRNDEHHMDHMKKIWGDTLGKNISTNGLNTCRYSMDEPGEFNDTMRHIDHIRVDF